MSDEDNSNKHTTTESDRSRMEDEDVEPTSPGSGRTVESTMPDSSPDEASDSSDSAGSASDSTTGSRSSQAEANQGASSVSGARSSVPAAASPREEATLKRVKAVSKLLDDAFRVPGTNFRFGIDPLFGILPVAGDAIPTMLSLYPVAEAYRFGVPKAMLAKMLALVAVDAVVGSIPVLGTVFDAVWKANKWNLGMLERHIEQRSIGP